jgi:predicted ATPase/DNA-binding SARP family transcriptional activator/tetratricopeptide (TPR) repeat protein
MEIRLLGPLEVVGDDGRVIDVGGPRPRALLTVLALAGGHPVAAERLLDQVWASDDAGRNRLLVQISRLRRLLGGEYVRTCAGGYALELPPDAVDVARFDRLAAAGRAALDRGDPSQAGRLLRRALSMWRGSPLTELVRTGNAGGVIARLEEARSAATEDRIEADLLVGGHRELTGEIEALVAAYPLRERLWGQLVVALYRSGRQGDALGAYRRARTVLAEELGVDPGPALRRLESQVLSQHPDLDEPATPAAPGVAAASDRDRGLGNLPAPASTLIGRGDELAALTRLLAAGRLVTVVGTGGVGKTRLAIEAARSLFADYSDGVGWVELAPVANDRAVASAAAAALGVAPIADHDTGGLLTRLSELLSRRHMLLVMDNCEHVIEGAAAVVDRLLARSPQLTVLATSREPLSVAGEALWPLEPLAAGAAAELFVARARALVPTFPSDERVMRAVSDICTRLDGLPLAIELAAARTRALSPDDVLDRLGSRFDLLTSGRRGAPERHQTLRAVVDWSYQMLFDAERRVFERMSVFAGPWSLQAAEQVCSAAQVEPGDVADLTARLVDKSLLTATITDRGLRFRMLVTLADYGRERLAARDELAAARTSHAQWVASLLDVPYGERGSLWFATVGEFAADIRRGMESALTAREADTALAIACGIGWFWGGGGVLAVSDEVWQWLVSSLALEHQGTAHRVRALAMAGQVGLVLGRDEALGYGERAVEIGRAVGDRPALAFALMLHGSALATAFGQRQRAVSLLEEASALLGREDDGWSLGMADLSHGVAALARGDPERAGGALRQAADRFAEIGSALSEATAMRHLTDVAIMCGRYDEAISALHRALSILPTANPAGVTRMAQLGCLYQANGEVEQSDRWHDRSVATAEDQRHPPLLAFAYNARGLTLRHRGHLAAAEKCHYRALRLFRQHGARLGSSVADVSLGYIAELRGDADKAERHHRTALAAACAAADRQGQAAALEGLAAVAALGDDADTTGRLLGAAATLREGTVGPILGAAAGMRETIIGRLFATERADIDRATARITDHTAFEAAVTTGADDPLAVLTANLT